MGITQLLFFAMMIGACSYAAVRGGAPERLTVAALVCALAMTMTFAHIRSSTRGAYSSIEVGIALTDLTLFLVIVVIALVSARRWPIAMASMMGCGLFAHLAKQLGPDILPRAYYIAVGVWSYPELILLAVATWRHRVRKTRYGVDHAWIWQLPRRYRNGGAVEELGRLTSQR